MCVRLIANCSGKKITRGGTWQLPFVLLRLLGDGHAVLGLLVHVVVGMDTHLVRQSAEHLQLVVRLLDALERALALRFGDGEAKLLEAAILRLGRKRQALWMGWG